MLGNLYFSFFNLITNLFVFAGCLFHNLRIFINPLSKVYYLILIFHEFICEYHINEISEIQLYYIETLSID